MTSFTKSFFIKILNKYLPAKKNYISLVEVKELVEGKKGGKKEKEVFRGNRSVCLFLSVDDDAKTTQS